MLWQCSPVTAGAWRSRRRNNNYFVASAWGIFSPCTPTLFASVPIDPKLGIIQQIRSFALRGYLEAITAEYPTG